MTTREEIMTMAREHFCRTENERGGAHECYEFSADEIVAFVRLAQAAAYERAADELLAKWPAWDGAAEAIRAIKEQA